MEKKETNEKFKSNFKYVFQDCKPILIELGLHAVKGVIVGFSMRLGGSLFENYSKVYLVNGHPKK